jgi:hypothetical protein
MSSWNAAHITPKQPIDETIRCIDRQFEYLRDHIDDGLVLIDNAVTEQLLKQIALGPKNWILTAASMPGPGLLTCSRS